MGHSPPGIEGHAWSWVGVKGQNVAGATSSRPKSNSTCSCSSGRGSQRVVSHTKTVNARQRNVVRRVNTIRDLIGQRIVDATIHVYINSHSYRPLLSHSTTLKCENFSERTLPLNSLLELVSLVFSRLDYIAMQY